MTTTNKENAWKTPATVLGLIAAFTTLLTLYITNKQESIKLTIENQRLEREDSINKAKLDIEADKAELEQEKLTAIEEERTRRLAELNQKIAAIDADIENCIVKINQAEVAMAIAVDKKGQKLSDEERAENDFNWDEAYNMRKSYIGSKERLEKEKEEVQSKIEQISGILK